MFIVNGEFCPECEAKTKVTLPENVTYASNT